jgi:lambda repressor-like predicted transcriptional regulator
MSNMGVGVGGCFVEYRPIPGASLYRLGSDRSVWTCSLPGHPGRRGRWRRRKLTHHKGGAISVVLHCDDGRPITRSLNRLMREVFPPVDADEEEAGPDPRASFGEDNGRSKITRAQADELRRLKKAGWTTADLMTRYGLSKSGVYAVFNGLAWAGTPPDLPDPAPADEMPAPTPRAKKGRRGVRVDRRHRALRQRPADHVPLEVLEVPRRAAGPGRAPLDEGEARRLHAEGWSVRELVARYGVRPHVLRAVLQGA